MCFLKITRNKNISQQPVFPQESWRP